MSYSYVPKSVYKPLKIEFEKLLHNMQAELRNNKVTMDIRLVGSGKYNCVTMDDSTHSWDLDFNLIIRKIPNELADSPGKLKDMIRRSLDKAKESGEFFKGYKVSYGKNSTVPITYKLSKGKEHIDFDIAIIMNDVCSSRLVNDKPEGQYISNQPRTNTFSDKDIKFIRSNGKSGKLRKLYLLKKNDKRYKTHSSSDIFSQAVNEILQELGKKRNHSTSNKNKEVKKMAKVSGNNHTKSQMDHHSNQKNPNNSAHKAVLNNRSNQLNPNNAQYKGGNNSKSGK